MCGERVCSLGRGEGGGKEGACVGVVVEQREGGESQGSNWSAGKNGLL